jgi:hypothetical protein
MHDKKTGALFMAAFECAAIINEEPLDNYTVRGRDFGLAFQAYDDLLDGGPILSYFTKENLALYIEKLLNPVLNRYPSLIPIHPFCQGDILCLTEKPS